MVGRGSVTEKTVIESKILVESPLILSIFIRYIILFAIYNRHFTKHI